METNSLRRRLSTVMPFLAILSCLILFGATGDAKAQAYWFERYEKATALIDAGNYDAAIVLLRAVIDEQPSPVCGFRVPGNRFIDYLPFYQRARIQVGRKDFVAASHSLDVEEAFGAVMSNRRTWDSFLSLRKQVEAQRSPESARAFLPQAPESR